MRWPSKEFAVARARQIVYNEDNLVLGYNMKPRGNALIDVSPNTNDGTLVSAPSVEKTVLGDSMYFDGVDDYINSGGGASIRALTDLTISMWIRPSNVTVAAYPLNYYLSAADAWGLVISGGNLAIYDDIDNAGASLYSTAIAVNQVYHIVAVMDNLENLLYVNGELVGSGTSSPDYWSSFAGTLYLGSRFVNLGFYNGRIIAPKLYSEAKNAAWVASQYALGANAVQGKTDWGAQESVAAEATAGDFLSNTPFRIGSGSWQVVSEVVDGKLCKVIECVSAGHIYIPTTLFKGSPTEDAYGTWDWWVYKPEASTIRLIFIASSPELYTDPTQNGYYFIYSNAQRLYLASLTGGTYGAMFSTADDVIPVDQWSNFRTTRDYANSFASYMNGQLVTAAAGTNPIVDPDFITASYMVFYSGAECKLAYSDQVGDHCYFKKLGVVAP